MNCEQLADRLARWIRPSPVGGDVEINMLRDLLFEFAAAGYGHSRRQRRRKGRGNHETNRAA